MHVLVPFAADGSEACLQVLRDGKSRQITVRAGERPSEDKLALNDRSERRGR